jgi:predicted porin
MKKILVLSALAAAAVSSFAQNSVTIYGVVDLAATKVSGVRGGSISQLNSGMMDGSRIGFRGNEDLGGGYRALFTAESRLEADTGGVSNRPPSGSQVADRYIQARYLLSSLPAANQAALQPVLNAVSGNIGAGIGVNLANNFWDRQVFLGLVTPVGAVLAGRQYTPAYEMTATFDTLQTQSALAFGQVASIPSSVDIRLSNSIAYRIVQGPFSAALMVAAGEGSTTTGKFYGANAMYKTPAFSAGVGYNTRENERGVKSLTNLVVGASLALGPGTVSGMYATVKDNAPTGLSGIAASVAPQVGAATASLIQNAYVEALKQDGKVMHLGYRMTTGANTFYVAYNKFDDSRPNNADTTSYGLVYSYALSKRTDISAQAVRMVNSALGQAAPGGGGYLGGVTTSAGTDSTSLGLGVRHRF